MVRATWLSMQDTEAGAAAAEKGGSGKVVTCDFFKLTGTEGPGTGEMASADLRSTQTRPPTLSSNRDNSGPNLERGPRDDRQALLLEQTDTQRVQPPARVGHVANAPRGRIALGYQHGIHLGQTV